MRFLIKSGIFIWNYTQLRDENVVGFISISAACGSMQVDFLIKLSLKHGWNCGIYSMLVNHKFNNAGLTKRIVSAVFLSLSLTSTLLVTSVHADGGMPIQDTVVFTVPENLATLSTEEISELRQSHALTLKKTASNEDEIHRAEEKLYHQLMDHDLVRLSIADVILKLIKEYEIEGEFKDTLMGYQSTFAVDMVENREAVASLADYPSYDFRFAAAYMSMLYAFQRYPDFYDRLKKDMVDENSHIGVYKKELDESYASVKQARAEMDFVKSGKDIEKVIAALDDELARREN